MEIKNTIIEATYETMSMFGINPIFHNEIEERYLKSTEPISVLIGLTSGLKGNVLLGMHQEVAFKLISAMMGGMEIKEIDEMAQSALGEILNMIVGAAVSKLQSEKLIDISPPSIITGSDVSITFSNIKANKLLFKLDQEIFNISYCSEAI